MRDLNVSEVQQVNGGWLPLIVGAAALLLSGCGGSQTSGEQESGPTRQDCLDAAGGFGDPSILDQCNTGNTGGGGG